MKWSTYTSLSIRERRTIRARQCEADCLKALEYWNRDFPDRVVGEGCFKEFLSIAIGLHSVHSLLSRGVPVDDAGKQKPMLTGTTPSPRAWARQPCQTFVDFTENEQPRTKGEQLAYWLAVLGPLAWGWRSPAKSGEKSRGTLQRGALQIIDDHFNGFDTSSRIFLFLDSANLTGWTTVEAARRYLAWSGQKDMVTRCIEETLCAQIHYPCLRSHCSSACSQPLTAERLITNPARAGRNSSLVP